MRDLVTQGRNNSARTWPENSILEVGEGERGFTDFAAIILQPGPKLGALLKVLSFINGFNSGRERSFSSDVVFTVPGSLRRL